MYEVESGIELPSTHSAVRVYPALSQGQSIVVPIGKRVSAANTYTQRGYKVITRKVGNDAVRVWRVA